MAAELLHSIEMESAKPRVICWENDMHGLSITQSESRRIGRLMDEKVGPSADRVLNDLDGQDT